MLELQGELFEGRIEQASQSNGGRPGRPGFSIPNNMQDDLLKRGILVMPMGPPTGCAQVHFNITGHGRRGVETEHGALKIRAAFHAAKTRMKHADRLTVQCAQLLAPHALVLPDGLQQFLGWGAEAIPQNGAREVLAPPGGVKVGSGWLHLELLLRRGSRKVKRQMNWRRPTTKGRISC